jgi:peptidylprolyl isomerase
LRKFAALLAGMAMAAGATAAQAADQIVMELKCGPVVIDLRPDLAPKHVAQIKTLASKGFYDGIIFHRVIAGFMAQTGDPTGTGTGGSDLPDIPAEFSSEPYVRGTVGMARSSNPNSANSQFFIMFTEYPSLNGNYTVWGKVSSGMNCIDQINKGEPPANPDKIIKMSVK